MNKREINEDIFNAYVNLSGAIISQARRDYFDSREILEKPKIKLQKIKGAGPKAKKETVRKILRKAYKHEIKRIYLEDALKVKDIKNLRENQAQWILENIKNVLEAAKAEQLRAQAKDQIEDVELFLGSEWFRNISLGLVDGHAMYERWDKEYEELRKERGEKNADTGGSIKNENERS